MAAPFLVIGIDFGTTQSGVGWALSTNPTDLKWISSWDSNAQNTDYDKVPTVISYNKNGIVSSWGIENVPLGDHQFKYFKLLLSDSGTEAARKLGDTNEDLARMRSLNKEPVDLAADYLRCLWQHVMKYFKAKQRSLFDQLPFKVILTVPANWDHAAQNRTRQAIVKAGILRTQPGRAGLQRTELDIVSEPEASALAAFNDVRRGLNLQVQKDETGPYVFANSKQKNDSFVICDAGGGTVDLISYKVDRLQPSLRLNMCSEATGDTCGAVFLDREFENRIRGSLSASFYENFKNDNYKAGVMWDSWKNHTRRLFTYREDEARPWMIPVIGGPNGGSVILTTREVKAIFDTVCRRISALVKKQVDSVKSETGVSPKAIVLVGGFGENTYLEGKLTHDFPTIKVERPPNAIRAIYFGAVARGLNGDIVLNHMPKYSYGFVHDKLWEEGKNYQAHDRKEDPDDPGKFWARDQIQWYQKRGESILYEDPVQHEYTQDFDAMSQLEGYTINIVYTESTHLHPSKAQTAGVKDLCSIVVNFGPNIWNDLKKTTFPNGTSCRTLKYTLQMRITAGSLRWCVLYKEGLVAEEKIAVTYE